jgi:DsbC/DsbD-like thiol-disulfide interchange protein
MLLGVDELLHGELKRQQYGAKVKAEVQLSNTMVTVTINIAEGWHINAHKPLQSNLIATVLSIGGKEWQLETVQYPEPKLQSLTWQQEKLALYTDTVQLRGKLTQISTNSNNIIPIKLKFQTCNDKICLPPEELQWKERL